MKKLRKWFKKYFIPHKDNNHAPHFLRHASMLSLLVAVIVVELGFLVHVFVVLDKTNFLASVLPNVLTNLTNEDRAKNNVAPLKENKLLVKAAKLKAEDMATYGYFAHTSPDGKTPWYWLDKVGYQYLKAGENLAVNFSESKNVEEAWMNSPSHYENIIKKDYTEIGIATAEGTYEGKPTTFVVQFFGTPAIVAATSPQTTSTEPKVIKSPTEKTSMPTVATATETPLPPVETETQILGEQEGVQINTQTTEKVAVGNKLKIFAQKVLSSPRQYVSLLYGGVIFLIVLAFTLLLRARSSREHPLLVVRGVLVISVVLLLISLNTKLLENRGELPGKENTANAIGY